MEKTLKELTVVEIKAAIYDRENEVAILKRELQMRLSAPVTKQAPEDVPVIEKESKK